MDPRGRRRAMNRIRETHDVRDHPDCPVTHDERPQQPA